MSTMHSVYFVLVLASAVPGMEVSFHYLFILLAVNAYFNFGEYMIHKYVFHNPSTIPSVYKAHWKHHEAPTMLRRLFIPIPVTLINDVFLAAIAFHFLPASWMSVVSAAHLSYLCFELSHYCSHQIDCKIIPSRLPAFHQNHHHHCDSNPSTNIGHKTESHSTIKPEAPLKLNEFNFGFTTPAWDILFGTSSGKFKLQQYPLCFLPISILSFANINELARFTTVFPVIASIMQRYFAVALVFASRECYILVSGNVFGMVPFCFDLVILLANFLQLYMSSFSLNLFSLVDVPTSLQILIMIVLAVLTSKMKSPWMRCIFNLLCMVSHAIA
jgi:hypothetical protein